MYILYWPGIVSIGTKVLTPAYRRTRSIIIPGKADAEGRLISQFGNNECVDLQTPEYIYIKKNDQINK